MNSSRRRFLKVLGATAVGSLAACARRHSWHWHGVLFGADALISLHGVDEKTGRRLTQMCFEKMRGLEDLFSLYRSDSVLCRLNRQGEVIDPPRAFRELMSTAVAFGDKTSGAFDITVQPLWELYHRHYVEEAASGPPDKAAIDRALDLVDYARVVIEQDRIALGKAGMAVTLNGIAQGYITDQVAEFLRNEGLTHTLVNMGEYRVLGNHPENRPWEIGVRGSSDFDAVIASVPLDNQALAMSGGYGFTFDPEGRRHHLFHPETGDHRPAAQTVCVTAATATAADALSTACAVVALDQAQAIAAENAVQLRIVKG